MLKYSRSAGFNITSITLMSHGNALKYRHIVRVWYWWYWKQKITSEAFYAICHWWWKWQWIKGMPPSGCSDNVFEVFRWLERLVPISVYPPKVPFLSLETAIPFPRKPYRNGTKVTFACRDSLLSPTATAYKVILDYFRIKYASASIIKNPQLPQ